MKSTKALFSKLSSIYHLSDKVKHALKTKRPVVALESTIITHGMPYPFNLKTAIEIEEIVESQGCVPATIALMDGKIKIGMERSELEILAKTGLDAIKTSRRDMALVTSKKLLGATTVSGTMIAAHKAGIDVFVTGGIGGVHRGAESSLDISADLTELGKTPMAVVCAGVKSILDIPKTLEYLETQGVSTITYGPTKDFPAFYLPKSGYKSQANLETVGECADMILANKEMGLNSGIVVAVPIPETFVDEDELKIGIESAVKEAEEKGIIGKDVTPFLLEKVSKITDGKSLEASTLDSNVDIALVKHNALIGSRIAYELAKKSHPKAVVGNQTKSRPVIIGGTVLDITFKTAAEKEAMISTSTPGEKSESMGGVGRNIAEACFRVGGNPLYISAVGADSCGSSILESLSSIGFDTSGIRVINTPTAIYNALLDKNGELVAAVADMRIHDQIIPTKYTELDETLQSEIMESSPKIIAVDGNLSPKLLSQISQFAKENNIQLLFEPTSVQKCEKVLDIEADIITPDLYEARHLAKLINPTAFTKIETKREANQLIDILSTRFTNIVLKMGKQGALVYTNQKTTLIPQAIVDVVSVTGAGDSMVGAIVCGINQGKDLVESTRGGMKAALLSVQSMQAVNPSLDSTIWK